MTARNMFIAVSSLLALWLGGPSTGQDARPASPKVRLDLHGYRPFRPHGSATAMAPARPLAQWLGVRLMVAPEALTLVGKKTIVHIDRASGRIVANGQSLQADPPNPAPKLVDGQLLVPLRALAQAFGATVIYEDYRNLS
jgi:Copper amine oxidase N-terminal domain